MIFLQSPITAPPGSPSLVSQCGDDYCGSDSGCQYPPAACSQNRRCSTVTYPSMDFESSRKTSSDSCSSMTEPRVRAYNLSRTLDLAPPVATNYSTRRSMSSLLKKHVALDPHPYYYNELLEDTIRGREREQDTLSEAFSFTDYKVRSHLINAQENQTMDWESCLEVEAKLADLQSIFASVAMNDLQEDEGFEKLLKLYISVQNEFSFEPDSATMESKLVKRFEEKAKWKYTRHMYTQAY